MKKKLALILLTLALVLYINQNKEGIRDIEAPETIDVEHNVKLPSTEKKQEDIQVQPKKTEVIKSNVPPKKVALQVKYPQVDKSFAPFDEFGNRYITVIKVVGDHLIYHGDVLIGKAEDLNRFKKQKYVKQAKPRRWTNGVVPYVIDASIPNYEQALSAIDYMNKYTNIELVEKEAEHKNYIYITKGDFACYSYVGMQGGMQEIYLSRLCHEKEVLHELMHTIGFFHEQNREDRDNYVQVLWENIDETHHMQFKKIPNDFMSTTNRPFDYHSIMLYNSSVFAKEPDVYSIVGQDGEVLRGNSILSEEDIERINSLYTK